MPNERIRRRRVQELGATSAKVIAGSIRKHSLTDPVLRHLWDLLDANRAPAATTLAAAMAIARHAESWIRAVAAWSPTSRSKIARFGELVRRLFCEYPVPSFMDSVWSLTIEDPSTGVSDRVLTIAVQNSARRVVQARRRHGM